MNINEFFTRMREEVSEYSKIRADSSAFLIWFLENFFRLEKQDSIDSVCDQKNDKGIDGIFVDDEEEIIYLFQSKFSPNNNQQQGDNDLRNFIGTREWFVDFESVNNLLASTACKELKSLIGRNKINNKTHYELITIFVTNKKFNQHALEYIENVKNIEAYDANSLFQKYSYFADDENIFPPIDLYLLNSSRIVYQLPDGTNARLYAISAKELIKLNGIQDRTLFYKNVRYGVGNTRVNKAIRETIQTKNEHKNFLLYHNGITIICEELDEYLDQKKITISRYAVINGCQSMLTFFENKNELSDSIFITVKIIKSNLTSHLVDNITYYANNQNAISLKDLRSNTSVQKTLQKEFDELFNKKVLYRRKKGEDITGYDELIDKDFAGQLILAVYQKEPHNTHLKNYIFGPNYSKIFSRKITAEKIYFIKQIYDVVKQNVHRLSNEQLRDYSLSLFFFVFSISEILREDELGKKILEDPLAYVTENKEILLEALNKLWDLITPDINFEIDEYTRENDNFFDYKNLYRNSQFVKSMSGKIIRDYVKDTRKNKNNSFSEIYRSIVENN